MPVTVFAGADWYEKEKSGIHLSRGPKSDKEMKHLDIAPIEVVVW